MKAKFILLALLGFAAASAPAQTILVDFGSSTRQMASPTSGTYWNNLTNLNASSFNSAPVGFALPLVTTTNAASGITLTVTDLFKAENSAGTTTPATGIPAFNFSNLGSDSLYVDSSDPTAGFTLSGLDPSMTYTFTIFASRTSSSETRSADYTFDGIGSPQTVTLDASNNTSNTISTTAITPNLDGTITFAMQRTSGSNFAYLGGLQIIAVPEPSAIVLLVGGLSFLAVRRRRFGNRA